MSHCYSLHSLCSCYSTPLPHSSTGWSTVPDIIATTTEGTVADHITAVAIPMAANTFSFMQSCIGSAVAAEARSSFHHMAESIEHSCPSRPSMGSCLSDTATVGSSSSSTASSSVAASTTASWLLTGSEGTSG